MSDRGVIVAEVHDVAARGALVPADENVDVPVERGREQQRLPVRTRCVQQPFDCRQKAHVGHAVRFVDDDSGDVVERDVATLDQVLEPTRRGYDDVDAAPQSLALRVVADPSVDREDATRFCGPQEQTQLGADLQRQLASGLQDERHRGPATDVVARERVRQDRGLDRKWRRDRAASETRHGVGGHAEIGEGDRQRAPVRGQATRNVEQPRRRCARRTPQCSRDGAPTAVAVDGFSRRRAASSGNARS